MHEQLTVHCCYGTDKQTDTKRNRISKHFLHIITELQNKPEHTKRCVRFVKNLRQRYRYISFIEWPSTSIVMLTSIGVKRSISQFTIKQNSLFASQSMQARSIVYESAGGFVNPHKISFMRILLIHALKISKQTLGKQVSCVYMCRLRHLYFSGN